MHFNLEYSAILRHKFRIESLSVLKLYESFEHAASDQYMDAELYCEMKGGTLRLTSCWLIGRACQRSLLASWGVSLLAATYHLPNTTLHYAYLQWRIMMRTISIEKYRKQTNKKTSLQNPVHHFQFIIISFGWIESSEMNQLEQSNNVWEIQNSSS